MYSGDLPSPELFDQEISHWKHKFDSASAMPDTCASALKQCDKIMFPNIHTLLKIACTIPVFSCECERGGSTLCRLRNHMRCSMTIERLTSLALMHIHYEHNIDLDEFVDIFSKLHPRHLVLSSVLND